MDITLARTFLAVVETGSFVAAADRVHVTQSTISMRIKVLEEQLGKRLFERGKAGAFSTPAALQFERHALAMVRIWEQARLEVALPEGYKAGITVGGPYSLWDGFLLNWLRQMRAAAPEIALRTQIGFSDVLMTRLVDGTLDIGVMYTPQGRPGLKIEGLFEEELVLVSSEPNPARELSANYVYVDWGPEFQADHTLNYPDTSTPGLYMELGSLGLRYILQNEASGYFPSRLVQAHLDSGKLRPVPGAPTFHYPAYVVYAGSIDAELVDLALGQLRKAVSEHTITGLAEGQKVTYDLQNGRDGKVSAANL